MPWRKGNRVQTISDADADLRTSAIFAEIREGLGVPYTNVVFQSYAAFPAFLDLHWKAFRPIVEQPTFFALAERLRADAYTRMHNYFAIPDLRAEMAGLSFSEGAMEEVAATVELFIYNHPLLLLILAAQLAAFDGPVGRGSILGDVESEPLRFETPPIFIDDEHVTPRVRTVFEALKRALPVPFVASDARAFARWPDFLEVSWRALSRLVNSAMYESAQHGLRESAFALTRELPGVVDMPAAQLAESGILENDIASIVRLTEQFVAAATALLLNVSFLKIALEGGTLQGKRSMRSEDFRLPKAQ